MFFHCLRLNRIGFVVASLGPRCSNAFSGAETERSQDALRDDAMIEMRKHEMERLNTYLLITTHAVWPKIAARRACDHPSVDECIVGRR
jgi:hypothetical protein